MPDFFASKVKGTPLFMAPEAVPKLRIQMPRDHRDVLARARTKWLHQEMQEHFVE